MRKHNDGNLDPSDMQNYSSNSDEVEMRRALGLSDQAPHSQHGQRAPSSSDRSPQRRRFVTDGQVPVVIIGRRDGTDTPASVGATPVNRLAVAEAALSAARDAHDRAERALNEAQATIRDLQTKLGHAVLERDEARELGRRTETDILALQAALESEREARRQAEESRQKLSAEQPSTARAGKSAQRTPKANRITTPKANAAEPQPVKWWLGPRKAQRSTIR